jgi:hypothetical protein
VDTPRPTTDDPDDDPDLTRPGRRTGRGAWSILPYLNQSLRTRPKAELPAADRPAEGPSASPEPKP